MAKSRKKVHIFVVSDATGMTADRVIRAALVQFSDIEPVFEKFDYVETRDQIKDILARAEELEAIVIYSFASRDLRRWLDLEKRDKTVHTLDLLGPPLRLMEKLWQISPDFRPGIFKSLESGTIRLAESIDFTLRHDDGQNLETVNRADLLLLGVSRTSKTPSSLYLSCNFNLKVANYPIVLGEEFPEHLLAIPIRRVGFTIDPRRAASIRKSRLKGSAGFDYSDIGHIRDELRYSHRIFKRAPGMQLIDVTHLSIEEIAGKIVESMTDRSF